MHKDYLDSILPSLMRDVRSQLDRRVPIDANTKSGTIDPFDQIYRVVYKLTMRTLGPWEIADDDKSCEETLGLFEMILASASTTKIIFPWLPTPGHMKRMYAGGKLYSIVRSIVRNRQKTGKRIEDSCQRFIDDGEDELRILKVSQASITSCACYLQQIYAY